MPRLPDFGEVSGVPCDQCGESAAAVHCADVSLCDSCWETIVSEHMRTLLGRDICGTIVWRGNQPAICAENRGHGFHD